MIHLSASCLQDVQFPFIVKEYLLIGYFMAFGRTFSQSFGIPESEFRKLGVMNPTLDVDMRLFVDPFLLTHSKHLEFSDCGIDTYEEHFTKIFNLISASKAPNDKAWQGAKTLFQFSESKGMSGTCLGYSKNSTKGHAFGKTKAEQSLIWAKQVIEMGVKDPELFSSLPLFEDGIGPDLISDMTVAIIIKCILDFNNRILDEFDKLLDKPILRSEFKLRGHNALLPKNPYSNHNEPIILLADDILHNLPALDDPKTIPAVVEHDVSLKERVNEHIGTIFQTKSKKDKEHVKDRALQSAAAFQTFLDLLKAMQSTGYDINSDPDGLLIWREAAASTVAINKLELSVEMELDRAERLDGVVVQIINQFIKLVEDNRLYKIFYSNDKPRPERFAQMLFFAIADSYCDQADIGMSAESDAGVGPVDFKFHDGNENVVVEIKLSTNTKTVSGYQKQLGAYGKAERSAYGHYVVIDVGKIGKKWQNLSEIAAENPEYAKLNRLYLVDGRPTPSASKR